MPRIVGYGAFTAVVLAAYEFTGGALKGYFQREDVDDYERKEMLRNRRRIPIEETLAEIGEGRGESPPTSSTPPDLCFGHGSPASRYPAARI